MQEKNRTPTKKVRKTWFIEIPLVKWLEETSEKENRTQGYYVNEALRIFQKNYKKITL